MTTTRDAYTDIHTCEFVETEKENGFVDLKLSEQILASNVSRRNLTDLEAENFGLQKMKWFSIDFDQSFTLLLQLS